MYWKQDLFLVPYQWSSAADPVATQAVWLFVSKDQGTSWRKISEAAPQVKAFNYRAEGDGEYWFAVRTVDRLGRTWPEGPYQPELRVFVDTTMPRIAELWSRRLENGVIEIGWRGSDQNLDPTSWKIEAQIDAAGTWQVVPATSSGAAAGTAAPATASAGEDTGHVLWQPPVGSQPNAVRATVLDRAGNSATYQTQISSIMTAGSAAASPPFATVAMPSGAPAEQSWLDTVTSRTPFRLSSSAANPADDGVTAYGMPPTVSTTGIGRSAEADPSQRNERIDARYAGPIVRGLPNPDSWNPPDDPVVRGSHDPANPETYGHNIGEVARPAPNENPTLNDIRPLEPYRQASVTRLPAAEESPSQYAPRAQPKLVGSRTFALEYDLEDTGRWGVAKVDLWGTRDGGRTWQSYGRDDDNRSPLVVTVDDEGLYGFRIAVQSAGSAAPLPPSAGDEPELWVAVDLRRPAIELTAIERGEGNLVDHLIFRWRAADDNLESRPISLFYSSRPGGPWSAIATNLEDTGEYAWRVERHVPTRFYVRAEARDTAGNLAAFQTREPLDLAPTQPSGRLRGADTVGPTAVGGDPSYR